MADKQLRIMLWATPRSLSTAMCRVMMNSGKKTKILFEPYSESYYFGPERVSTRYQHTHPYPDPAQSYSSIKRRLEMPYPDAELVFAKDMPYYLSPNRLTADWIPDGYVHTFITRHPRRTVTSYLRVIEKHLPGWEAFDPAECGYEESVEMSRLLRQQGHRVIVLDADDLMNNPEGMLRVYCREVGLEFSSSMLNWKPLSDADFYSLFCAIWEPEWFLQMKKSTSINRRPKPCQQTSSNDVSYDARMRDLIERTVEDNMGYYNELIHFCLKAEEDSCPPYSSRFSSLFTLKGINPSFMSLAAVGILMFVASLLLAVHWPLDGLHDHGL